MVEEEVERALRQLDAGVRFDWGPVAARHLHEASGCLVIVDVLTFTTATTVATGRGMEVLPYHLGAPGLESFAADHGAELAVRRREVSAAHPWSLSPGTLLRGPLAARLVLPSPNGSAIAAIAAESGGLALASCLRNSGAVTSWLLDNGYGTANRPITVVAAGERWHDGSLRPALEDGLGAGAVLSGLRAAGLPLSVEAAAMAVAYDATGDVAAAVRGSGSALELDGVGCAQDVELAVALDVDVHVPVLTDGAFAAG